jgi:hypothetical protein
MSLHAGSVFPGRILGLGGGLSRADDRGIRRASPAAAVPESACVTGSTLPVAMVTGWQDDEFVAEVCT